jgi:hypothetical protein
MQQVEYHQKDIIHAEEIQAHSNIRTRSYERKPKINIMRISYPG